MRRDGGPARRCRWWLAPDTLAARCQLCQVPVMLQVVLVRDLAVRRNMLVFAAALAQQ